VVRCNKHYCEDWSAIPGLFRQWREHSPECGVIAFLPEAEGGQVATLQQAARECGLPLIGAIFPGLLVDTGFVQRGALLLQFEQAPARFIATRIHDESGPSGNVATLIDTARASLPKRGRSTLFLIFDAMVPDIGSIIHQLYAGLPEQKSYAGINAGSETFQPTDCLFDEQTLFSNGLIGFWLPEDAAVVVKHEYPVSISTLKATSGSANRVEHINGRPAFEVYREIIQAEFGTTVTHENFYQLGVHFPLGLVTAVDVLVRIPVDFDEKGALFCIGEIPPDSILRVLRAPSIEESRCAAVIARDLPATANSADDLLVFYCAGRRLHFGADAALELEHLRAATGAPHLYGALTLGEIDTIEYLGIPRFHNAALVCVR